MEEEPKPEGEGAGSKDLMLDTVKLKALIGSVDGVTTQIRLARKEVNDEREARQKDKRSNTRFKITIVVLIVVIAVISYWGFKTVRDKSNAIVATRNSSIITACNKDNDSAKKQHELWNGILLIAPRPPDPVKVSAFLNFVSDTPNHREAINTILSTSPQDPTQIAALKQLLDDTFPQRPCDLASINRYYASGGT